MSIISENEKLIELHKKGVIDDFEFTHRREKLLNSINSNRKIDIPKVEIYRENNFITKKIFIKFTCFLLIFFLVIYFFLNKDIDQGKSFNSTLISNERVNQELNKNEINQKNNIQSEEAKSLTQEESNIKSNPNECQNIKYYENLAQLAAKANVASKVGDYRSTCVILQDVINGIELCKSYAPKDLLDNMTVFYEKTSHFCYCAKTNC